MDYESEDSPILTAALFLCSGKFVLTLSKIWWPLYLTTVWKSRPVIAGPGGLSERPLRHWPISRLDFKSALQGLWKSYTRASWPQRLQDAFSSFLNIGFIAVMFDLISFLYMLLFRLMIIFLSFIIVGILKNFYVLMWKLLFIYG